MKTRFAPSPTGSLHIGSVRTALFSWLYARHLDGSFVLRIEDTDKERNSEEFLNVIYNSLTWLGMDWDEGPQKGGDFGPYRQSERGEIYQRYVQKLLDAGRAYEKEGAVWFKHLGERYEVFDDHRKKEVTKVKTEPTVIDDRIRGRVERLEDEDFVIVRSDGSPTFHLVNVVDDIEMQITHVIRGEDLSTAAHLHRLLQALLGYPAPVYRHHPLLTDESGRRLAKRDKAATLKAQRESGATPHDIFQQLKLAPINR